jgi:hypothetical protein
VKTSEIDNNDVVLFLYHYAIFNFFSFASTQNSELYSSLRTSCSLQKRASEKERVRICATRPGVDTRRLEKRVAATLLLSLR